jgi:uncharacterized SAM-binding protein YcdF (DUF218 family)
VLERHGVHPGAVEPVSIDPGLFGTYSEAEALATLVRKHQWESLLLITSPHHTRRVRESFRQCLKGAGIALRVIPSKQQASLGELLKELIKLTVYRVVLLD